MAAAFALTLGLSACGSAPAEEIAPGPSADGVDLRGSTIGGDFELTSHTGETVRWSDFEGKYRLLYFGFTSCPDICPTDVQRFTKGLSQFEEANPEREGEVQPIFISIDPERDTIEALNQFVNAFHPRLIGLTGSQEDIDEVLKSFGATGTKLPEDERGWYNMTHTTLTYLFAPDGSPLGIIPTDKGADGVTAELERWVN